MGVGYNRRGVMLSHFSVKNYKCLADVSLPLTPIHVLIGQNDTGKTSLFEAIRAALTTLSEIQPNKQALDELFRGDWSGRELVWNNANSNIVYFTGQFDEQLKTSGGHSGFLVAFDFQREGHTFSSNIAISPSQCELDGQTINPTGPGSSTGIAEDTRKRFQTHARRVDVVRWQPNMMSKPAAITPFHRFRLDPDGFGLPKVLDEILGYDRRHYEKLEAIFCEYFPQFSGVRLETVSAWERPIGNQDTWKRAIGKEVQLVGKRKAVRLQQASDGAILLLGFLAITHSQDPPGMLLIEEPENGIHPQRLIEVAQLLRQFVEREENAPQIILTTHSPYLLSQFQPEEVTLMRRLEDGSVKAHPLRDAKHIQERMGDGFYLGELWYTLNEEDLLK
jgi:predicted ATPase